MPNEKDPSGTGPRPALRRSSCGSPRSRIWPISPTSGSPTIRAPTPWPAWRATCSPMPRSRASRSPACRWAAISRSRSCARRRSASPGSHCSIPRRAPNCRSRRRRRLDFIALAERGHFARVTETLLPLLIHPSRLGERSLTDTVKSMAQKHRQGRFHAPAARHHEPRRQPGAARDASPARRWSCAAGRMRLTPLARHEEMAAGIKGARLEVIEDCGHLSTLERPAEVNAALRRWLAA